MDFGFCGMKRRITPPAGFLAGLGLLWFPAITCREMPYQWEAFVTVESPFWVFSAPIIWRWGNPGSLW